jgi:hypothetical protein
LNVKPESKHRSQGSRWSATPLYALVLTSAAFYVAACASGGSGGTEAPATSGAAVTLSATPPSPDPRVGLRAGTVKRNPLDTTRFIVDQPAAEAAWNIRLVSNTPSQGYFNGVTNSDLAFTKNYAIQGNYNGYQVWDISNPAKVVLKTAFLCPASQSDVSVYKHLLFVSAEAPSARLDCAPGGVPDPVSKERIRGIRIFDGTDISKPKYLTNVQSCRGSHTHTVVEDPDDKENVYIFISGSSSVRPSEELPGCAGFIVPPGLTQQQADSVQQVFMQNAWRDPNSSYFNIEVVQVPLANPAAAHVISKPRIFENLVRAPTHAPPAADAGQGRGGRGGRGNVTIPGPQPGPNQCHDITVYPAIGMAGGACGGYGLLLDIRDPKNMRRIDAVADTNFSYWHSATFSNDGKKILFSDEWGGGGAPRCRDTDNLNWGADAIFTIEEGNKMKFRSYYKMPAPQTTLENCVSHNGSLLPIPGRDVLVQGFYQGGITVFDWTNPDKPFEIAFFDRGPFDPARMRSAGSWSVYWYNGVIVSSEIARGLDIFELVPSPHISANEIAAAKTVRWDELNTQGQPKIVFPPSFSLARAYLDQLERNQGLAAERIASVRAALTAAEKDSGQKRKDALNSLATALHGEANSAKDAPKAHMLAGAIGDLANATR